MSRLPVYVALLRGVNVGGKNMLPMKDLALVFARAGCSGVRTYIQSGNVLFNAPRAVAAGLPDLVCGRIAEQFGCRTPVLLRTVSELANVVRCNPFLEAGAQENHLHVMFLESQPDDARVAALDPDRSPPDAFTVRGREIYLQCPNGMAKTKLSNAWFDSRLATVSTGRNWRTVLKLFEMAQQ